MVYVDSVALQSGAQLRPELVLPHPTHHRSLRSQPAARDGLIGALSPGGGLPVYSPDRLAALRGALAAHDDVHVDASNDQHARGHRILLSDPAHAARGRVITDNPRNPLHWGDRESCVRRILQTPGSSSLSP